MAYNISFDASNKADFVADISAIDVDTGETIDLTGADVAIKIEDDNCCQMVNATIDNGLITQPSSTVLELNIPAATMKRFRAGTYRMGCVIGLNDSIEQLSVGSLVVYDGIASL